TTIVLNIVGIDYDSLDENQLVRELAARLGLCILSTRKKRGSVLVELELTPAQAEHLLTAAKAGKLADLHVSGAWKLQSQKRSEIHAAEETDFELDSIFIRQRRRWDRCLLPVAASAAALLITIWFTSSQRIEREITKLAQEHSAREEKATRA